MAEKWITPFKKQCFVVIGASINMSQVGMVMGFVAVLVPQLRVEDSPIPVDDSSGSWIAAIPGFALMIGNLIIPTLMAKMGRKKASIISILIIISGWSVLVAAQNVTWIYIARLLQGLSVGMSSCLTPIVIGEYTSPKNRGAFTIVMSLVMAAGTLTVHAVGSYVTWRTTSLVIAIITLVDLLIVALSPETPSWLAEQGRYEDSKTSFRWLRGNEEMEEFDKMIQASIVSQESRESSNAKSALSSKIKWYVMTMKKKEFYKPILIMIHLYTMGQWAGINILGPYIVDIVHYTVGKDANIPLIVISVDVQRVISCILAVFIIRNVKRRTMLFVSCGINVVVLLVSAGYIYAKNYNELPDYPLIGILLIHALMMTVAVGSLPLPFTIAGEIFALRYRSLSSGISSLICSLNIFISVKIFSFLIRSIGLYGTYCVFAGIMIYCLVFVWFLLPETKDRTLQDIEEEFKGNLVEVGLKEAQPLKVEDV